MAEEPQQLKSDIEGTRSQLSADLDALSDRVNPSNVAQRQVDKAKAGVVGVKDRLMGSAHDAADSVGDAASATGDRAGRGVSQVTSRTQGNPLAAGLIAFGAGLLLSALIPASAKETEAAGTLVETAKDKGQPLIDEAKDVASDIGGSLGEHAEDAVAQVKDSAQEAVGTVQADARDAVGTVRDHGTSAAENVKGSAQDAKNS